MRSADAATECFRFDRLNVTVVTAQVERDLTMDDAAGETGLRAVVTRIQLLSRLVVDHGVRYTPEAIIGEERSVRIELVCSCKCALKILVL